MANPNSAKALREQRAPIAASIRKLSDDGLAVDADGKYTEAWTKANADYNHLTTRIEAAERADVIDHDQRAPVGDPRRTGRVIGLASLRIASWVGSPLLKIEVPESKPQIPPPAGKYQAGAWNWPFSPSTRFQYNWVETRR